MLFSHITLPFFRKWQFCTFPEPLGKTTREILWNGFVKQQNVFFPPKSLSQSWQANEERKAEALKVLGQFCLERPKNEVTVQDAFAAALGWGSFLSWGAYGGLGASVLLWLKSHAAIVWMTLYTEVLLASVVILWIEKTYQHTKSVRSYNKRFQRWAGLLWNKSLPSASVNGSVLVFFLVLNPQSNTYFHRE